MDLSHHTLARFAGTRFSIAAVETLRVVEAEGPITSHAVAERLGVGHSTAHMRLTRLEAHGYVARQFAEADAGAVYTWASVDPEAAPLRRAA